MPGLVLAIVFVFGWVLVYLCRTESARDALPSYSRHERWWVRLTPLVIGLHMALGCVCVSVMPDIPLWRALLAIAIFAAGIAFWFWGRMLIGPVRLRRLPDDPPQRLRRDGPFRIVRNPLYFGDLVAASAPLIVAGWTFPFLGLTYILCVIALTVRAGQEERRLHEQLGAAYETYCREVRSLIPFLW